MSYFKNEIVLVRHGQTEWNLIKRTQGHLDSPLTEIGIAQAKETAEKLRAKPIDIIISSPLGRALETAKIIKEIIQVDEIETDKLLMERHLGILQGRTKNELIGLFPHFWGPDGKFLQNASVPEGESLQDFLQRISKFIGRLEKIADSKRALIVTHDGVLHALVGVIKRIPFEQVQQDYTFRHGEPFTL